MRINDPVGSPTGLGHDQSKTEDPFDLDLKIIELKDENHMMTVLSKLGCTMLCSMTCTTSNHCGTNTCPPTMGPTCACPPTTTQPCNM